MPYSITVHFVPNDMLLGASHCGKVNSGESNFNSCHLSPFTPTGCAPLSHSTVHWSMLFLQLTDLLFVIIFVDDLWPTDIYGHLKLKGYSFIKELVTLPTLSCKLRDFVYGARLC